MVARFEPENHVREIVQGYRRSAAELPLLVVGAPLRTPTTTPPACAAAADGRVRLLGAVWDQDQIDQLYANALTYWHGHSVGGTNPSLLRAAGCGHRTYAYDVIFNREVLDEWGQYFSSSEDVAELLMKAEGDPEQVRDRGRELQDSIRRYNWDDVASRYEALCRRLADRDFPRRRPSGRRTGAWSGPYRSATDAVNSSFVWGGPWRWRTGSLPPGYIKVLVRDLRAQKLHNRRRTCDL